MVFYLHHLTIPPERLRTVVKLILVVQFGNCRVFPDEQLPELDCVAECIVKSFQRIPDVGTTTWPMFDDATRAVVCSPRLSIRTTTNYFSHHSSTPSTPYHPSS